MAFTRSLLTRLCEGLVRDFLANTDVQAYWKTRVFKGPFLGNDSSIVTPQVTVLPAPGAGLTEPGVSGVQGNHVLSVLVGIFEPVRMEPLPSGTSALDEYDRLQLLKTIIAKGTDGNNDGKIVDPDNAGSSDPVQRLLNNDMPIFNDRPPSYILKKDGSLVCAFWSFQSDFTTRIDNITLLRK